MSTQGILLIMETQGNSMSNLRADIIALVAQYNSLLEAVEDNPTCPLAEKALRWFLKDYPGIPNYDARGNWIGAVAYENGWTA